MGLGGGGGGGMNASNMHTSKLDQYTQCWTLYLKWTGKKVKTN